MSALPIWSTTCEALAGGRIDGQAEPEITRPLPAIFLADARRGAAHPGFDQAFEDLAAAARTFGLAAFAQRNSYTCGALGYFTARLAERGLVALAATNGPALLAGSGADQAGLLHQPAVVRCAAERRAAAGHRPGLERHGFRQHPPGSG